MAGLAWCLFKCFHRFFFFFFFEWFVLLNFDVIYSRCQSFVKYVFENYIYLQSEQ